MFPSSHEYNIIIDNLTPQAISDHGQENKSLLSVSKPPASSSSPVSLAGSITTLTCPKISSERYLIPTPNIYPSKATLSRRPSSDTQSQSDTNVSIGNIASKTGNAMNGCMETGASRSNGGRSNDSKGKNERRVSAPPKDDLDVQSIINERRPSKLKSGNSMGATSIVGDQYPPSSTRAGNYAHVYVAEERSEEVSPMSTGNMSDSIMGSSSASGSGSGSVTGSGTVNGSVSGSRNGSAVVHVTEGVCATIGSDVRIYVDDTDSASSNNHQRRKPSEGTPEASTTISSVTALPDVTIEETGKRFDGASSGGPSDPS